MGVAYDLFGNGKTALKFNLGKYMQANSAANNDLDLNPIIRTAISTTRMWTDTNKDFVANCVLANPEKNGECAAMDNKNLGKEVFDRTYDPAFTEGWGSRMYNWGLGVSVQQEVAPRVSVNVGYFRNWWGNWYTVDNRANALSDWTPFSIKAPVDPRLPGGGGQTIPGLYNLVPSAVGPVDEWATNSRNYAEQTENWQGVDVGVSARLRNGLTVQGGTSTGRRLSDACALKAALPEQGPGTRGDTSSIAGGSPVNPYCREVEPYLTSIPGARDLHDSADRSPGQRHVAQRPGRRSGGELRGDQCGRRGTRTLGRDLSAGNVTVNLIEPSTFYADSAEQHRHARREDLPVRPDADADRVRRLQPDEHGRRDGLQPDVLADVDHVADADGDSAGAVREDQRAVRLLNAALWAPGFRPGATAGKTKARSRKRAGLFCR